MVEIRCFERQILTCGNKRGKPRMDRWIGVPASYSEKLPGICGADIKTAAEQTILKTGGRIREILKQFTLVKVKRLHPIIQSNDIRHIYRKCEKRFAEPI